MNSTSFKQGRRGKGNIFTWAGGNGGYIFHDSCSADGYSQSIYSISVGAYSDDGSPAYYDEKCSAKQTVAYVESIHNSNLKAVSMHKGCIINMSIMYNR